VRECGRLAGVKGWKERVYNREKCKKTPENGKESPYCADAKGMNQ
jgi:hypothetical protein